LLVWAEPLVPLALTVLALTVLALTVLRLESLPPKVAVPLMAPQLVSLLPKAVVLRTVLPLSLHMVDVPPSVVSEVN
jgi:hypothetical protein